MAYTLPKRKEGKSAPDVVQTLTCKIIVWDAVKPGEYEPAPPSSDKCIIVRECSEIEIEDNYKKLINTAVVKFPKGTVIHRTLVPSDEKHPVYSERMDDGAVIEKREGGAVAVPSDFHVKQRIQIFLAYYEETYETAVNYKKRLEKIEEAFPKTPDFDGYIVQCSASSPIEIKCENIARALKVKTCKAIPPRENMKVNDLFKSAADKGKYDLLAGTGIKLHPKTAGYDINLGKIGIQEGWSVADLLSTWEQAHLYSYIKYEDQEPYLVIGYTYFSGDIKESILSYSNVNATGTDIQFHYDVAKDDLSLLNTDPLFLAVEAQCMTNDEKFYRVTLTLNPDWKSGDPESEKFRLINETHLSEKSFKMMGVTGAKVKEKVDLSLYNVIPFISSKRGLSKEELVKEAKAYFTNYNFNGVEGKLTVFGDYHIKSATKVSLRDDIHPEKNGLYFVDEVVTKFGVNGFRQTLNLPYCIVKPNQEEKNKEDSK